MKYEDQAEKLKMENSALSDTVQANAAELLRQEEQIHELELELTISKVRLSVKFYTIRTLTSKME